jgi:hypothetical protein
MTSGSMLLEAQVNERLVAGHLRCVELLCTRLGEPERSSVLVTLRKVTTAHRASPRLLKRVLNAQEALLDAEAGARETFEAASGAPWDADAADRAVAMAFAYEAARAAEAAATERWRRHTADIEACQAEIAAALEGGSVPNKVSSVVERHAAPEPTSPDETADGHTVEWAARDSNPELLA